MKRSDRLRAIGWFVLASGLAGSGVLYWTAARNAEASLDDVNALGYARSLQHGMGVMMGPSGMVLSEWRESVTSPIGQALMAAIGVALLAGYFFRVAWVLDSDEETS